VPVERQWQRARTPLSRRDKRLLGAVACIAAAATTVLVVASFVQHAPASNAGCIVAEVPSTMGGARLRSCGAAAHTFCRTQGRRDGRIAAACRTQGFAADLRP
jgi:hypothetical protein